MSHHSKTAEIVYNAATELLSGVIGDERPFHMRAYSGGSRGHASVPAKLAQQYLHGQAATLSSHLANTPEIKKDGHYQQRGGTLPAGHYNCIYIQHHRTFRECIFLDPAADAKAIFSPFSPHPIPHFRTNEFFIHGSGVLGSDGCIVSTNPAERHRLNLAVKNFRAGGGRVVLLVKNVSYQLPAELAGQYA